MFEALVIVTREGVEAALVVAIVLAFLGRTGRMDRAPWVFAGVGVALVLSAVGAWTVPALVENSDLVEGWALLAGAACVATLIWWMARTGKTMKAEIERGLGRVAKGAGAAGWGLAAFVGVMIFREGLETVIFLTAISFNTGGLERFLGALLGLALAAFFGVLFVRGTLRVDLARFFRVTTVVLVVLAVQLVVGAYHEFAELGMLPANRNSMAVVGPIVRYDYLLFAFAVLLTLLLVGARRAPAPAVEAANPAERRKIESRRRRDRVVRRGTMLAALTVFGVLVTGFLSQARVPAKEADTPVEIHEGAVRLAAERLSDGDVHFFSTEVEGRRVRFFVLLRPQGDLVACLDACLICSDVGYYQESGILVCRNCVAPMNMSSIGQEGGCNPIPLDSRREGAELVVPASGLTAGARHFQPTR